MRTRAPSARMSLEALEERTMLSGVAAALERSDAKIASTTALQSEYSTVVTGSLITFTATVENASTDAPISAGKVNFIAESPKPTKLGVVSLDKAGQASVTTTDLTAIANYKVKAEFTPTKPNISASVSAPVTVKVIPVPLNVPTVTTVTSVATSAQVGQYLPLVATVTDAGTGDQVDAGKVEPVTGKVAFVTQGPNPIVLGEATLKRDGVATLASNRLVNLGSYQIAAEFLPYNNYFAVSTLTSIPVAIMPQTALSPTVTTVQSPTSQIETGEPVGFNVTVQNSSSSLAGGALTLFTVGRHSQVLAESQVGAFGQPLGFGVSALQKAGTYRVEASYTPNTNRFAKSTSAPFAVTVTPLTAARFRVVPLKVSSPPGRPVSFEVTAVNSRGKPVTNYTGTVDISSPTDSVTVFPKGVYVALDSGARAPLSLNSAEINVGSYTFTTADQGSHTFDGAVTFHKGGAETVRVVQANNSKVVGKGTFAIG